MLRIPPIASVSEAELCKAKSDSDYYLGPDDKRRGWDGRGAEQLGLTGSPEYEQFERLIHGIGPQSRATRNRYERRTYRLVLRTQPSGGG